MRRSVGQATRIVGWAGARDHTCRSPRVRFAPAHQEPRALVPTCADSQRPAARIGFTLVELLAVLLILGILTASAAPTFTDSLMYHRVESAALRLRNDLQLARKTAVTKSAACSLEFTTATAYTLSDLDSLDRVGQAYTVDLSKSPYQVKVTSVDFSGSRRVSFNGYGLPSSDGSIVLEAGAHRRQVDVDAQGHVTITP